MQDRLLAAELEVCRSCPSSIISSLSQDFVTVDMRSL